MNESLYKVSCSGKKVRSASTEYLCRGDYTSCRMSCVLTPEIKPVKPGFLPAHKPGFTSLKTGGLPGFSGTRVPGLHSLVVSGRFSPLPAPFPPRDLLRAPLPLYRFLPRSTLRSTRFSARSAHMLHWRRRPVEMKSFEYSLFK